MFNIIKIGMLRAENKRLKEELAQKDITIQYLNGCVNKANKRYLDLVNFVVRPVPFESLDFPNSSVKAEGQISIHDILEN